MNFSNVKSELNGKIDQLQREKQILDANSKAIILKEQTDAATKLREEKIKLDSELRKIYAFTMNEFRQFFNSCDLINDRTYKKLIYQVRGILEELSSSDTAIRRLVGADMQQKTEEAVAQALIH